MDPVPAKILKFRELSKLQSTYVDALPKLADKNDRIHTSFMQTGTATGRLSSRDPNLPFRLGKSYARSVGVNVRLCRIAIIILSGILSACVTAFAGPVSFIGIAVPYLMREVLKSSKPILLIPASFLSGAVFCMLSDLLARMLFAPTEMNISAVTSLFGAPIVIFMIIKRGRKR